jgi:hypothetical protein
MSTTLEMLGLAIDKNPVDFAAVADQLLRAKSVDALEARKIELAQSIYGMAEDEVEDDDAVDTEFDSPEDESDETDDAEDLDIDLEDFDLEDLDLDIDLEDIDDDGQDA